MKKHGFGRLYVPDRTHHGYEAHVHTGDYDPEGSPHRYFQILG